MRLRDDAPEGDYLKCEACGRDAECAIWGTRPGTETHVCYRCVGGWQDGAPTYGDIPKDAEAGPIYRAYTAKWLEEKRKAGKAA